MIIRTASWAEQAAIEQAGEVLVAEVDGAVAGYAVLDGGEMREVRVEPPFRGSGIGTALVEAAVHQARRSGLSLTASASGPRQIQFLERCGFASEGEADVPSGDVRMSR